MTSKTIQPNTSQVSWLRRLAVTAAPAVLFGTGVAACGDDVDDVISFAEYIGATAEVLDNNGMEPDSDIDCDGSTVTNKLTCTGTTTGGLSISSTGEDLGENTATLVVIVDGDILYDGHQLSTHEGLRRRP